MAIRSRFPGLVINLGNNRISHISPKAFDETVVRVLDLSSNALTTLDSRVFAPIAQNMIKIGGGALIVGGNIQNE